MPETNALQEIVIGVHFEGAINITIPEVAHFVSIFEDEYPHYQQTPPLPPVELHPSGDPEVVFSQRDLMPRLILRSLDQSRVLQFQADRFAIGWAKNTPIEASANYPGYDQLRGEWKTILDRFYNWSSTLSGGNPKSRLIELAYYNAISLERHGKLRKLSDIMKFNDLKGRELIQFKMAWTEIIGDLYGGGRVMAQIGTGVASPSTPILGYNFNGLAPMSEEANSTPSLDLLDALHNKILDMHQSAIISS